MQSLDTSPGLTGWQWLFRLAGLTAVALGVAELVLPARWPGGRALAGGGATGHRQRLGGRSARRGPWPGALPAGRFTGMAILWSFPPGLVTVAT